LFWKIDAFLVQEIKEDEKLELVLNPGIIRYFSSFKKNKDA